jgi:hypothetical protein
MNAVDAHGGVPFIKEDLAALIKVIGSDGVEGGKERRREAREAPRLSRGTGLTVERLRRRDDRHRAAAGAMPETVA